MVMGADGLINKMEVPMGYDENLKTIDFYKIHPSYLPFVGEKYEEYRILHIADSHFLNQMEKTETVGIDYFFEHWWNESCVDAIKQLDCEGWIDTRKVIENYMSGITGSYSIFINMTKSFSKVILDREIKKISLQDKGVYKYFSFMFFFQMPSLYAGKKYWDSIYKSALKKNNKELAYDVWDITVKKSIEVVDKVIDILAPKTIVFTSISARNAYKNNSGKYAEDERIIYTSHPGAPYSWNKNLTSLEGRKGVDIFEDGLRRIYK